MNQAPGTDPDEPAASGTATIERLHDRYGGPVDAALRRLNRILQTAAGATLALLLVWTVGDIASRTLFSRPFPGTIELTELGVVVLVYLGLARAENQDAHISVDLLFVQLGKTAQLAMRIFAGTVSFGVISLLTWRLFVFAGELDAGGYTTGVLRIPLYPAALLGVTGSAAFAVAALGNVVVSTRAWIRER
jgi:TRAP-type C4-dicarboxylate transport system permease small subunit